MLQHNDLPFQNIVTRWMASEAYQRLRSPAGKAAADAEGTAGE